MDYFVCDAHADTLYRLVMAPHEHCDLSLERLKQGKVGLQVMALYVGGDPQQQVVQQLFDHMLTQYDKLKKEGWTQAFDPKEATGGEVRTMLSIEGCEVIGDQLDRLDHYRALGVRMAAPVWNHVNLLATPAAKDASTGLTALGRQAVRRMQQLGIAVDISHLNEAGSADILAMGAKPPLASHSCCRALCDHPRNLTDQQLKGLFSAGGYVGVNFFPLFLTGGAAAISDVVNHIDHMHQMGGAGMVGFGSDFDGIGQKPEGLTGPRDFPRLLEALSLRGYGDQALRDIAGQSFVNYYKRINDS